MRYYSLIFSTFFFLAFFSQVATGDEQTVSSSAQTVYYSPIDAGTLQQSREPYRAQPMIGSNSSVDDYLFNSLPGDPVAPPSSLDVKRQLKEILETSRREASSTGNGSSEQSTSQSPSGNSDNSSSTTPSPLPSSTGGTVMAKEFIAGKNGVVAILQNGSTIRVTQTTDGYYDEQNRKVVLVEGGEDMTISKADAAPINQILLIVLAFGSTFAAIFIGFIAWDNQRRLEEAIVSQNQRFTGNGSDAFSPNLNSMEPETFSFSSDSFAGKSLDGFDSGTSFRTIA